MKSIAQMNKDELVELHDKFNLDLPDEPYTKKELLFSLEESNITNQTLKMFQKKNEDEKIKVEPRFSGIAEGSVVVVMRRKNSSFTHGKYTFLDTKPYVLMTEADAQELMKSTKGFSIASVEEIKRFYKK